MDVFEMAMQREKSAEEYYRELAENAPDKGLTAVLNRLADSEVRHYDVIVAMKDAVGEAPVELDPFLGDVRAMFTEIRDRDVQFEKGTQQISVYRKAQEFERESMKLYRDAADATDDPKAKRLLQALAGQEKMHEKILGTIIEMVSRPLPGGWLEDAEWFHLEDY